MPTTLRDFAAHFDRSVLPLKKESSSVTMRSHLNTILPALGEVELAGLTYPVLQDFVTSLSGKLEPKSVKNVWSTLSNLLHRAEREGLVTRVPRPDLPKLSYQEQEWLTLEQMRTLIAAASEPAFFALLSETGVRLGEALALTPDDLDLENLTLSINKGVFRGISGSPKSRSSNRVLSVSRWLAAILSRQNLLHSPDTTTFQTRKGTPWSANKAVETIHRTCEQVGIKHVGAHAFRRGNATTLASGLGVHTKIVAYRLGHASKDITLGVYVKPLPGFDREAADRLGEALFGSLTHTSG
jgi:integrase